MMRGILFSGLLRCGGREDEIQLGSPWFGEVRGKDFFAYSHKKSRLYMQIPKYAAVFSLFMKNENDMNTMA